MAPGLTTPSFLFSLPLVISASREKEPWVPLHILLCDLVRILFVLPNFAFKVCLNDIKKEYVL